MPEFSEGITIPEEKIPKGEITKEQGSTCSKCGVFNESGSVYCETCGSRVFESDLEKNYKREERTDFHNPTNIKGLNRYVNEFLDSDDEITSQKSFNKLMSQYGRKKYIEVLHIIDNILFDSHDRVLVKKITKALGKCPSISVSNIYAYFGGGNCDKDIDDDRNFAIKSIRDAIEGSLKDKSTIMNGLKALNSITQGYGSKNNSHRWGDGVIADNMHIFEEAVIDKTSDYEVYRKIMELFETIFYREDTDFQESVENKGQVIQVIGNYISSFGLDPGTTFKAWAESDLEASVSTSNRNFFRTIENNLSTMRKIESTRPNAVSVLTEEFGIKDFGRYPEEMLINQFEKRYDDNLPYGVIIYPYSDHNGVFYNNVDVFRNLSDKLLGKYHIRIFECEDKVEIAKVFRKSKNRYRDHKISFMILGGHGTEYSIKFGGEDDKHNLRRSDFYDLGSGRSEDELKKFVEVEQEGHVYPKRYDRRMLSLKSFFEPDSTIILVSCSTGAQSGIAQELSNVLDIKILAPNTPTNIKTINPQIDANGSLNFIVEYTDKGVEKAYMSGEKISG